MTFSRLFFYSMSLTVLLVCQSALAASGQVPSKCKINDKSLRAVKYRIGSYERSRLAPEGPPVLGIGVSVKPEQINADYLVLLARNLNQRFCKEDRLVVGIYDRYEIAVRFRGEFQEALDAFRGEYFLDRTTGEEYVSFTTVPDYQRNYDSRIKIDLKASSAHCKIQR